MLTMERKRLPTQQLKRLVLRLTQITVRRLNSNNTNNNEIFKFQQERSFICTELVELVVPFPELICEQYAIVTQSKPRVVRPFSLLSAMLFAGYNDVNTIRVLLDASADIILQVLEHADEDGDLPLHYACFATLLSNNDDVIVFLAKLNPKLVGRKNKRGCSPFELALATRRSARVLTAMLDLFPEAAASVSCARNVLENYDSLDLVDRVLSVFPYSGEDGSDRYLKLDLTGNQHVSVGHTHRNISKICPQVSRLHLKITDNESGKSIFKYLLAELHRYQSLKELTVDIKIASQGSHIWGNDFFIALHFALRKNKSIADMKIFVDGGYNVGLYRVIEAGLMDNKTMRCFQINSHRLTFKSYYREQSTGVATLKLTESCREGSLCVARPNFSSSPFMQFLNNDLHVLNLASFTLHKPMVGTVLPSKDFLTEAIHMLLMASSGLKSVNLFQYEIDMLPILEALETNQCLKHFNVHSSSNSVKRKDAQNACLRLLSRDNMTLTEICSLSEDNTNISYYLNLNRMGRSIMRNSDICSREIVQCLLAPRNDNYLPRDKASIAGIVYGLLRELPGSWCHSELGHKQASSPTLPSRKRKDRELYQYDYITDPMLAVASPQPLIRPRN